MNVLLTGANGFLGRVFFQYLACSCDVKTLSKTSGDYIINLVQSVPKFNEYYDVVIHSAGLAHATPRHLGEAELFRKVNVIGTENLVKGLENLGRIPKRFVFISSVAVYGRSEGDLINESSELKAIDACGNSKIQAEQFLMEWCRKHNVTATILRLPMVVGLNPPGNLGAMIKGIRKGYYFDISGGSAKKSMVLASDVAKFVLKASEIGGIYNLTDGYHPAFNELSNNISYQLGKSTPMNLPFWVAKLLAVGGDLMGHNAPLSSIKLKKITSNLTFDDSKAREAFGWDPSPVLKGLKVVL